MNAPDRHRPTPRPLQSAPAPASAAAAARPPATPRSDDAAHPPGRLQLGWVVRQLMAEGVMAAADGERVLSLGNRSTQVHPLAALAEMNLRSPDARHGLLTSSA